MFQEYCPLYTQFVRLVVYQRYQPDWLPMRGKYNERRASNYKRASQAIQEGNAMGLEYSVTQTLPLYTAGLW